MKTQAPPRPATVTVKDVLDALQTRCALDITHTQELLALHSQTQKMIGNKGKSQLVTRHKDLKSALKVLTRYWEQEMTHELDLPFSEAILNRQDAARPPL